MAEVHVSVVEAKRPTVTIVITPDGVQYAGGKRKSPTVITILPHGFSLNYRKQVRRYDN